MNSNQSDEIKKTVADVALYLIGFIQINLSKSNLLKTRDFT